MQKTIMNTVTGTMIAIAMLFIIGYMNLGDLNNFERMELHMMSTGERIMVVLGLGFENLIGVFI